MVADTDIQALIILDVGDDDRGTLQNNIGTIWAAYADKGAVFPRLQEYYTERRAIDVMLGTLREYTDFETDGALRVWLHQRWTHLMDKRGAVCKQIEVEERKAMAQTPPVLLPMTTESMELPPAETPPPDSFVLDANDPQYRGSPYYPGSPNTGGGQR